MSTDTSSENTPPADNGQPARVLTRRDILAARARQRRRNRPYVVGGLILLAALMVIPIVGFVQTFVLPPRDLALRVENTVYTMGDVVDFLRFHQRLSEETGKEFDLGTSLFDAMQVISENEIAYQKAPVLGVTLEPGELEKAIRASLGFAEMTDEEAAQPSSVASINEKKRQFLNNVGLSEDEYRNIVRKDLFRSKVRDRLAEDVPRVQEQVHLWTIVLENYEPDTARRIRQRLKAGESISDLAREFSKDPDVQRNKGETGWLPRSVMPEYDKYLFGVDEDGNRVLPLQELSDPVPKAGGKGYVLLYVSEYSPAREVDSGPFEVLKDKAFAEWVAARRAELDVYFVLNSKVYDWVNRQVAIASILPSPTPQPGVPGFGSVPGLVGPGG